MKINFKKLCVKVAALMLALTLMPSLSVMADESGAGFVPIPEKIKAIIPGDVSGSAVPGGVVCAITLSSQRERGEHMGTTMYSVDIRAVNTRMLAMLVEQLKQQYMDDSQSMCEDIRKTALNDVPQGVTVEKMVLHEYEWGVGWTRLTTASYQNANGSRTNYPSYDGTFGGFVGNAYFRLGVTNAASEKEIIDIAKALAAEVPGIDMVLCESLLEPPAADKPSTPATPNPDTKPSSNPAKKKATPTSSKVTINGKDVPFEAYNIDGNNYFKLRDLAFSLNGTEKQFSVGWDGNANCITLVSGEGYAATGGEMSISGDAKEKEAVLTSSKVILDGRVLNLTAYNIGGNNYFKLRDVGEELDFMVKWNDALRTIEIDTSKGYEN